MRIAERVMARLLREADDLGDIVFSPRRIDAPRGEPNTRFEDELYWDIDRWLVHVEAEDDLGERIERLMKNPRYGDFFAAPPPGAVIYRGMGLHADELGEMIGVPPEEIEASQKGRRRGDFDVELHGPVASWSHRASTARYFADKTAHEIDGYSVVIAAAVDDNRGRLFDLDAAVRRIDKWESFVDEREVLAFDMVRAFEVTWR